MLYTAVYCKVSAAYTFVCTELVLTEMCVPLLSESPSLCVYDTKWPPLNNFIHHKAGS